MDVSLVDRGMVLYIVTTLAVCVVSEHRHVRDDDLGRFFGRVPTSAHRAVE